MKCVICNQAETLPGLTSLVLERGEMSLTVNNIPALVCPVCGEAYTDEAVTINILHHAEKLSRAGTKVDTWEFAQTEGQQPE